MEVLDKILKQPYFSWVSELSKAYPEAEVFLVGGAVRDAVLKRETKDYDFVVRNVQARHLQEFLASVGIVNFAGRVFGVYKFVPDQGYDEFKASGLDSFDIALPRTEHAWGTGGYRDVEVQSDHEMPIEQDLGRRDFTINAVAIKLSKMEVIDPHKGMDGIKKKVVKAVGDPVERFNEDYTRMLRGLRFACELGFEIEPKTMAALQDVMPSINDKRDDLKEPVHSPLAEFVAPREVVSKELTKAFYADPVRAFDLYDESGAFEQLMPEVLKMKACPQPEEYHAEGDVWEHTRLALEKINSPEFKQAFPNAKQSTLLIMALVLHDIGKPIMLKTPEEDGVDRVRFDEHAEVGAGLAREIARRLVLSIMDEDSPYHVDYDKLHWLIKSHLLLLHTKAEDFKAATVEKYFFNDRWPGDELLQLVFCDAIATVPKDGEPEMQNVFDMQARIKRMEGAVRGRKGLPKPILNGDEIMQILKIPPGPGVGEIKQAVREEQLSVRVTNKEEAIVFIKENFA